MKIIADTRRLPPLKALRVLEAIHLTGSVTRAAQQLRVSHSAVSHQVRVLENWSATALFTRNGRTTVLTQAGRSLAMTANRAFDEVRHEIDRLPLRQVNPVTIATLPLIATEIIMPHLPSFTKKEPHIRLHVSLALSDRPTMAIPDLQIMFIRRAAVLASDVLLLAGDAIPACSPSFLAHSERAPEDVIAAGPHIHDEDLRMWPAWVERYRPDIKDALANETTKILLEGSLLIHVAVSQGLGVGFVRRALVEDKIASGQLLVCSNAAIDSDWVYVLRVAAERAEDAQVQVVVSWLVNICAC
jgi:LysR family glycine cleavage system transcriptional activator